jgi:bifunctional non-homologous end joining protein LigD
VQKKGGTVYHPIVTDPRSLVWLANQNSITPHVWIARVPDLWHPDICVFDLDPSEEQPETLSAAAIALRDLLSELGLESWVKTSGSKGFHIVVPLDGSANYVDVGRLANAAGALLVRRDPKHFTQEFSKRERGGRILIDTGRNAYHATFAAPYSVRAKPGAPVSAPCTWDEVKNGAGPRSFLLRGMADRVSTAGDLWSEMLIRGQTLRPAIERLRRLGG